MNAAFCLLAVAALGVDVTWQPLDEGGVEYIIQIAPEQVDRMVKLDDLVSEVPKGLDVRRYRITIGNDKLPQPMTFAKVSPSKSASPERPIQRRELVAEGAIPASATEPALTAESELPEATPDAIEAAQVDPAEPAEIEGPVLPSAETTAKKPITGTFADPEPQDEEGGEATPLRVNKSPASDSDDALFRSPTTRPLSSRYADEPVEDRITRAPAKSNRFVEEEESLDEAQRAPTLSNAMRTSQADARGASGFDRDSGSGETSWIVAIFFVLLLSAGLNMYLFWIAHEARVRYQALLEKYRSAGGKLAVEVV